MRPVALLTLLLLASPAAALVPNSEREFRAHLDALREAGSLTYEESIVVRVQRVFAPTELPAPLRGASPEPAKSATLLLHEYGQIRDGLDPLTAAAVDRLIARDPIAESVESFVYETPNLALTWSVEGPDAVPAADLDFNGVPDFVERIGAWGETAWSAFTAAGFAAPHDGRIPVSFREMSAYGYTHVDAGVPRIVLHRDFVGFPQNQDPDGHAAGAAKVTVAHELKHASQHAASGWTEGGWLEADATWAEDFVFDETNDYLHYLPFNSPVSAPADWMPASYEDCLWHHSLVESHGEIVLVRFFERRSANPHEPILRTFDHVLRERGSSLGRALETLGVWSYFSGANAPGRPAGFEEAESYPTPPLRAYLAEAAETRTDQLSALGTHLVLAGRAGRTGETELSFVGDRGAAFSLNAVITDIAGSRSVVRVPMASPTSSSANLPRPWEEIASVLVIATNLSGDTGAGYSITLNDENSVGVLEIAETAPGLEPNRPNPFRSTTAIAFSLPAATSVRLEIFDVSGRLVRRLFDGRSLSAGRHESGWDGRDEVGRASAPGVYYYRLETDGGSATRRMLLLR